MIEISLGKLVLLALIALIVLGPEKLPGAARTAGALLRRVRSGWDNVRAEVERELEIEEIKRAAREAAASAEAAQKDLHESIQQVKQPLAGVDAMLRAPAAAGGGETTGEAASGADHPAVDHAAADHRVDTVAHPDSAVPATAGAQAELPLAQPADPASQHGESTHGGI